MVWKSISQGKMQANQIINIIWQYFLGKKITLFFLVKKIQIRSNIFWGMRFIFLYSCYFNILRG